MEGALPGLLVCHKVQVCEVVGLKHWRVCMQIFAAQVLLSNPLHTCIEKPQLHPHMHI
jgi:hypothetical protein